MRSEELQHLALHLPAGALDAAERQGMILVDHALGHGRGGERQIVALDDVAQQRRVGDAHRRRAEHRDRPPRGGDQFACARDRGIGRRSDFCGRRQRRHRLVGRRDRHIFRQVEMHRPHRLGEREADRLDQRLADAALLQLQRRLGDRLEQRVVVDPHLDAAAELIGVEVAGDRDHRRAIEPGVADAGREVGRARAERRDAKPRRARHAAGDIGGKARRAFMRRQHEIDAALAHRLHQREHVAARNAEAAGDAGGFERGDDEIGVVHDSSSLRMG